MRSYNPKVFVYDNKGHKVSYTTVFCHNFKSKLLKNLKNVRYDDEQAQIRSIKRALPEFLQSSKINIVELGSYIYEINVPDQQKYMLRISGIGNSFNNGWDKIKLSDLLS